MNSRHTTINHAYSALTNLVTELGKATTEDQRMPGHGQIAVKYYGLYLRPIVLALDMKCLAKRLEAEKASLARCTELQSSLEALLE